MLCWNGSCHNPFMLCWNGSCYNPFMLCWIGSCYNPFMLSATVQYLDTYSNMFTIQVTASRVQCCLSCGAFLACYSRSQIKSFYVQFHSKVSKMVWNFYHGSIVHAFVRFPDGQSTWTFRTISSYVQCCMGFTHMWQVVMQVSEINLYLSCSLTLPSNSLLSYFDPHAATFFLALSIPTVLFSSPVSRSYL